MNRSLFLLTFVFISLLPVAASASTFSGSVGGATGGIVITVPTATPPAGTYSITQDVTLSAPGFSSIHYTSDGTTPTCTSGSTFSTTISVASSLILKALSCYTDGESPVVGSAVASFEYTISPAEVPTPSGGGGGGNGPIAGSLPGGGGSGNPPTNPPAPPAPPTTPPAPPAAPEQSFVAPPSGGSFEPSYSAAPNAIAPTPPQQQDAMTDPLAGVDITEAQMASAASGGRDFPDYLLEIILALLVLWIAYKTWKNFQLYYGYN